MVVPWKQLNIIAHLLAPGKTRPLMIIIFPSCKPPWIGPLNGILCVDDNNNATRKYLVWVCKCVWICPDELII